MHKHLGPGLLESVYEPCFIDAMTSSGLFVKSQIYVPVHFKGKDLGGILKLDLFVNDLIIVERVCKVTKGLNSVKLCDLRASVVSSNLFFNDSKDLIQFMPTTLSTITCPSCGHHKEEQMPVDACQFFYECEKCKTILKPKPGDCCVFCSYGTVVCPPKQVEGEGSNCCG